MARKRLHRNVLALGAVSLLTDFSGEMIYPLLPVFLTNTLGAGPAPAPREKYGLKRTRRNPIISLSGDPNRLWT